MAKKKDKIKGEQLELIDVAPKNLKAILAAVKVYKEHQKVRIASLKSEIAEKQHVLELVKVANLVPLSDGIIRFECDGKIISIEPRDEVIRIKQKQVKVKTKKKT